MMRKMFRFNYHIRYNVIYQLTINIKKRYKRLNRRIVQLRKEYI